MRGDLVCNNFGTVNGLPDWHGSRDNVIMSDYKDCYVAFLDILGFKSLLKTEKCNDIKQLFDILVNFVPRLLTKNNEVYNKARYYIMSDSVVVYINSRYENAFMALTEICLQIQVKLAACNPPVLIRGAIEKGQLYHKGNIIFGEALSNAYVLESTLAKYPRIIFTDATRRAGLKNTGKFYVFDYNQMFYKIDEDLLYYIDCFNTFDYIPSLNISSVSEAVDFENIYFERLLNYTEERLGVETNSSIRDKYLWLRRKILQKVEKKLSNRTLWAEKNADCFRKLCG